MSNELKKQPVQDQTVAQAIAALNLVLDTKTSTSKGGSQKPLKWVGKVELNTKAMPAIQSFIETCGRNAYCVAIIRSVSAALVEGNGSHTFDNVADVEEFDRKTVTKAYRALGKTVKAEDNPRMGHAWGYAMLGATSWDNVSTSVAVKAWMKKYCDANGILAFFKVSS